MLHFRDEAHLHRWLKSRDLPRGGVLSPEQGWRLAHGWYRNKLEPDWRRHTPDEAETLLRDVGLIGDFWRLR